MYTRIPPRSVITQAHQPDLARQHFLTFLYDLTTFKFSSYVGVTQAPQTLEQRPAHSRCLKDVAAGGKLRNPNCNSAVSCGNAIVSLHGK